MSGRPAFLTVTYSESGLSTLDYERKMVREKDVKFDGEDGTLELTDVRLVWYKAPEKKKRGGLFGSLKKVGALAGAIAGAAILEGVGREVGGIGGAAIRGIGRGIGYAAVGAAISSWTADAFYNRSESGETESLAVPLVAISNAAQSGNRLIVELKSGGTLEFEFKQKKVIPSVVANLKAAQDEGKCPYCGAPVGPGPNCTNCGAPIGGTGAVGAGTAPAMGGGSGATRVHATIHEGTGEGPTKIHATIREGEGAEYTVTVESRGGYCPNCGNPVPAGSKFCNNCGHKLA